MAKYRSRLQTFVSHEADNLPLGQGQNTETKTHSRGRASFPAIRSRRPSLLIHSAPNSQMSNNYMPESPSIDPEAELLMLDRPHSYPESADPVWTVVSALQQMEQVSLINLAETFLGKPALDDQGEPCKLSRSEVVVLVIEWFKMWLDKSGMGAIILKELPHIYVRTHWQSIDDMDCKSFLGQLAERLGHDISESRIYFFRETLLKQMYSSLPRKTGTQGEKRVLINFCNGTLELLQGDETLREFRKTDNLSHQLPFEYNQDASCPLFDKYLLRVLPDPASRNILSEFMGWIFLKDLKLEKALVLYGQGDNGKSVFFDIINALLGEQNVSNISLSSLSRPEKRADLGQALLNFDSEINDRCDVDFFKKLTSGEPIDARRLYKNVHIMRNYARLAFNANVLPKNTEHTEGFFRRFLIVPFTERITELEKDRDLARKIIDSELSGVFNWVMVGLRRLRETRRFSECKAADNALSDYRKESDSVALFLDEKGLEASLDGKIGKDELYQEYRLLCTRAGSRPLEKGEFGKRLKHHQVDDSKSGSSRFWRLARREPDVNSASQCP